MCMKVPDDCIRWQVSLITASGAWFGLGICQSRGDSHEGFHRPLEEIASIFGNAQEWVVSGTGGTRGM